MRKHLPAILLFLSSLTIYIATLAPTVATIFDDSLELQLALPTFAIIHPTGYPLYSLLGWLFTRLVPLGDAAYRANLFSAVAASATVALFYPLARRLGAARWPSFLAALVFALGPVWWSQATIAEVYTLQGLLTALILLALLRWESAPEPEHRRRDLMLAGLGIGLGLAHHRMTLLLLPGVLPFLVWADPSLLRRPRAWISPLLALLAPLLLYALLPLRAHIGSLDGSYARIGFLGWVLGGGYSTFLRDNPFGIERSFGDLFRLLAEQYGILGIVLPFAGYTLWRLQPRRLLLLVLIAIADLLFARWYLVADVQVFLIPSFVVWAAGIAVGLTALWDAVRTYVAALLRRLGTPSAASTWFRAFGLFFALFLLTWPVALARQRWPDLDRSQPPVRAWGVHDYGIDMLTSAAPQARIVGLLGEMTLLRYFQRTQGLRPDVITVAADPEPERLEAITAGIHTQQPTYTTRPLAGLAETYSLSAEGPLIRIWPAGQADPKDLPTRTFASVPSDPPLRLLGWDARLRSPRSGPGVRVRLLWQSDAHPPPDMKISARLLTSDGTLLAQRDDFPVHNAYPPSRWRPFERVLDAYDLPLETRPSTSLTLLIILYNPSDGRELARWQTSGLTFQP
ncbi:MAG: DUF2723 domain-containing protein [Caldilineae bacterium]|nr:MAG: DUF2723 domain-containing protein [Caldilineae bacterium]